MSKYIKIMFISLLLLVLGGCKGTMVYNVNNSSFNGVGASDSAIFNKIKSAALKRGWSIKKVKPGLAEATIYLRSHYAAITIAYNSNGYSIKYKDSKNLKYNKSRNTIHKNYNGWVRNLKRQIDISLSNIEVSGS